MNKNNMRFLIFFLSLILMYLIFKKLSTPSDVILDNIYEPQVVKLDNSKSKTAKIGYCYIFKVKDYYKCVYIIKLESDFIHFCVINDKFIDKPKIEDILNSKVYLGKSPMGFVDYSFWMISLASEDFKLFYDEAELIGSINLEKFKYEIGGGSSCIGKVSKYLENVKFENNKFITFKELNFNELY